MILNSEFSTATGGASNHLFPSEAHPKTMRIWPSLPSKIPVFFPLMLIILQQSHLSSSFWAKTGEEFSQFPNIIFVYNLEIACNLILKCSKLLNKRNVDSFQMVQGKQTSVKVKLFYVNNVSFRFKPSYD